MDSLQQLRSAIEKEHWASWQDLFPEENNPQQELHFDSMTLLDIQHFNGIIDSIHSQNTTTQMGDKFKPYKLLRLPQKQNHIKNQQESLSENESQFDLSSGSTKRKEAYPTKNFLQTFKTSFLSYLQKHFNGTEQEFKNMKIVRRIKGKKGISMKDYQKLFNNSIFRPILKNYFREKVIMRDLMISRVKENRKKHYFTKVHVFEEAFISRKFTQINQKQLRYRNHNVVHIY